jgi:hypothetical protein
MSETFPITRSDSRVGIARPLRLSRRAHEESVPFSRRLSGIISQCGALARYLLSTSGAGWHFVDGLIATILFDHPAIFTIRIFGRVLQYQSPVFPFGNLPALLSTAASRLTTAGADCHFWAVCYQYRWGHTSPSHSSGCKKRPFSLFEP